MARAKKAKNGQTVKVHYVGTLDDGTQFDSSRDRGETLEFEIGAKNLLPDFENEVVGMKVGETKNFTIKEAYGQSNPEAIIDVSKEHFPDDFTFEVGSVVQGTNQVGQPIRATIRAVTDKTVSLDHNHPLVGKDLNFEVELVDLS